jgi:hypothetical protein
MSKRLIALLLVLVMGTATGLYVLREGEIRRELNDGDAAYDLLCEGLRTEALETGSPGAVAHLIDAFRVELSSLARMFPRWYDQYESDPSAYNCV